jgi:putative multiple sugar transport system permease protein
LLLGIAVAAAFWVVEHHSRTRPLKSGGNVVPMTLFALKNGLVAVLIVYFCNLLSTYPGIPTMLVIMSVLTGVYTFIMNRIVIGRWIYAVGGNLKAAKLSGGNFLGDVRNCMDLTTHLHST